MKVLRIQFRNLNSLPEGDVDLEHGALAEAGIFAITGPTGSGKSTVLDAVTLALYGRAARYGSLPNPPDIMSRHTGECRAEVLFEVPRGRFSARWELRRARKKPGGALQPSQRTVLDANGVVLAQKINEADRLVEELTGLDYDRFLRSVLLAQGEFAQFLKAGKDDRAALLESLTGTRIYSDLGVLAFQEYTTRENALVAAEAGIERIVPLGYDERLERCSAIGRFTVEIETLTVKRDALTRRIQLGRQLSELLVSGGELAQKQTALAAERNALVPEMERLARHRLAQPFLGDLQALDSLAERVTFERSGDEIARATAANARGALASGLHAASLLAGELVSDVDTAVSEARRSATKLESQRAAADEWLATHAVDKALEVELAAIVERLSGLASAREKDTTATRERQGLTGERQAAAERCASLQGVLQDLAGRESAAAAAAKSARSVWDALLAGRSLDFIQVELDSLDQRRKALLDLQDAFDKRAAAECRNGVLADEAAACVQRGDEERAQEERCRAEARRCEERLELVRENVALLKRIAKLEDQRPLLKPGQPCPLCGALEHPFASENAQPSAGLRDAEKTLAAAKSAAAAAAAAAQNAAEARARAEQALSELKKRTGEAQAELDACGMRQTALSNTLAITDSDRLATALADNTNTRDTRTALMGSIRTAEKEAARAELEHARAQGETAAVREKIAAEHSVISRLDERIVGADALLVEAGRQIKAITAELAEGLRAFGVTVPAAYSEQSTGKSLEERRKMWQRQSAERQRLETEARQAVARTAECEGQAAELRKHAARFAEFAPATDLGAVVADPRECTRLQRQWRTLDDASVALAVLNAELAAAGAAAEERRLILRNTEDALRRSSEALHKRLAAAPVLPFADVGALRAARLDETDAQRIAHFQTGLEQRASDIAARLGQIDEQCRRLRGTAAPETAQLPELEAELKALNGLAVEATEQRTTLRNDLARDDENRRIRETRFAALAGERRRLAIWERLRHLIGSADGAKFRQFAQGLSLDIVLRHANRHLSRLNDRYRLQRAPGAELMLEIVDLHQAGTTRPMMSLSGGESFLASLALALGLSDLAGRNVRIDSLFIDEGFGSLDADTLDTAVAALDTLRLNNKTIGVISHVELLKERIPVQIRVEKLAGGVSLLHAPEAGWAT